MCQDSQVTHVDHVVGSHAPLDAESRVLARELINDVIDLKGLFAFEGVGVVGGVGRVVAG